MWQAKIGQISRPQAVPHGSQWNDIGVFACLVSLCTDSQICRDCLREAAFWPVAVVWPISVSLIAPPPAAEYPLHLAFVDAEMLYRCQALHVRPGSSEYSDSLDDGSVACSHSIKASCIPFVSSGGSRCGRSQVGGVD